MCCHFKATLALVYLLECHLRLYGFLFYEEFLIIASVPDAVLEMRNLYEYTIPVRYINGDWWTDNRPLPLFFDNGEEPGWRTEGVWRDLRVTLAHRSLKEVFKNNDWWVHPLARASGLPWLLFSSGGNSMIQMESSHVDGLSEFFETRKISDICTIEYFQNSNNLALLSAITDLASRLHLHLLHNHASPWSDLKEKTLQPLFHWVDRHLVSSPQ